MARRDFGLARREGRPYSFVERQPNSQGRRGTRGRPRGGPGPATPGRNPAVSSLSHGLQSPRLRRRAEIGALALLLASLFAAVTQSSSEGHERDVLEEALRRGADRLVELQSPEGAWSIMPGAQPDVRQAGRSGRALLLAYEITRDPRHLVAARRAARAVLAELRAGRAASTCNLQLLADVGPAVGQPSLVETARTAWTNRHGAPEPDRARAEARELLSMPVPATWDEGNWRNYLLLRAAEEADLARSLGHAAWSDAFVIEAAGAWAPKHDHDYWASAAGSMLGALARSQDPRAARLQLAHRGLLETNEVIDGVSWNDTPYDSYVYVSETAAALSGRAVQERGARERSATFAGLEFLASRQAPHGGWGAVLSLSELAANDGEEDVAPAAEAEAETPDLDAQVVQALALGLGARG
jgi:hypothetical protein